MLFTFLIMFSVLAEPSEWPQFRGPKSDGHAVGDQDCPLEFSDHQNVVWTVQIPGLGWSSPVIVEDRVFLTTAISDGQSLSLHALAFEVATGELIWNRQVRRLDQVPTIHSKNSHASPTPVVRDGSVYVHFGPQGTAKLSAKEGAIEWLSVELDYPPVHGNGGSPMLHEGVLTVVCDGSKDPFVAGFDAQTGKVLWRTNRALRGRQSHSFVTPTVAMIEGQAQLLAPGPDHFAAYDIQSGKELWRVVAPGWSVVPQPALGHGMIFYNHDYDFPELLAVKLGGSGDVTNSHIVWRNNKGAPSTPSPLLVGDELYFVSDKGIASCVDAKSGKSHWQQRLEGSYSASPIYAQGRILFLNEGGLATWIAAEKQFKTLQANQLTGMTYATPAILDGSIYLRTDSRLFRFALP